MGVKGLWKLISPCGRTIDIATLRGKTLAVDASIWMTQFLKAMRDSEGRMVQNGHLIGTLKRICRLLYHRIKTIFVFDGGIPYLKRRIMEKRRMRITQDQSRRQRAARGLLVNQLILQQSQKEQPPIFIQKEEEETKTKKPETPPVIEIDESEEEEDESMKEEEEIDNDGDDDDDDDEYDDQFTSINDIDFKVLRALPRKEQFNIISRVQDSRESRRSALLPVAGDPHKYSSTQLSHFLKDARKKKELKGIQKELANRTSMDGSRIISDASKEYILYVDKQIVEEETKDEESVVKESPSKGKTKQNYESSFNEDKQIMERKRTRLFEENSPVKNKVEVLNIESEEEEDEFSFEPTSTTQFHSNTSSTQPNVTIKDHSNKERNVEKLLENDQMVLVQQLYEALSGTVDHDTCQALLVANNWRIEETLLECTEEGSYSDRSKDDNAQLTTSSKRSIDENKKAGDFHDHGDVPSYEKIKVADLVAQGDGKILFQFRPSDITKESIALFQDIELDDNEDENEEEESVSQTRNDEVELEWEDEAAIKTEHTIKTEESEGSDESFATAIGEMQVDGEPINLDEINAKINSAAPIDAVSQPDRINQDEANVSEPQSNRLAKDLEETQKEISKPIYQDEEEEEEEEENPIEVARSETAQSSVIPSDEALKRALGISSNLTSWASTVVQRVINTREGASITNKTPPAKLKVKRETPTSSQSKVGNRLTPKSEPIQISEPAIEKLKEEAKELRQEHRRASRDADTVTPEMREEVMELLTLFGFPFIESPMEAEAQCASLELNGIVDGVVTEDSDAFLFGARKVYKNIFTEKKMVEAYHVDEIEEQLGLSREQFIQLALLMGGDYAEGIKGIGIVNAIEVLHAFPGLEGLKQFRTWVNEPAYISSSDGKKKKKKYVPNEDDTPEQIEFKQTHRNARSKWLVNDDFPEAHVISAYMNPRVESYNRVQNIVWNEPDIEGIREFCKTKLFMKDERIEKEVMETIKMYSSKKNVQTSLEQFFVRYEDKTRFAAIRSKRMAKAVHGIRNRGGNLDNQEDDSLVAMDEFGNVLSVEQRATGRTAATIDRKRLKKKKKQNGKKKKNNVILTSSSSSSSTSESESDPLL